MSIRAIRWIVIHEWHEIAGHRVVKLYDIGTDEEDFRKEKSESEEEVGVFIWKLGSM